MKQQTLALSLKSHFTFETFWEGESQKIITQQLKHLQLGDVIYLWGESTSGLSHLLQASCHYWQKQSWHCLYVDLKTSLDFITMLPHTIEGMQLVVIDHLEAALNNPPYEEALFHLYNRAITEKITLIWAANSAPESLACHLADLKSRLAAALILHLQSLNDHDKHFALQYYAKQKGLELNNEVAQYLLTHYSRDLAQLIHLVDALDHAALQAQRRLTIPFVKEHLTHSLI
jgi:DnaA family protein